MPKKTDETFWRHFKSTELFSSLRAVFLMLFAADTFHFSVWRTGFLIFGYGFCESVEQWRDYRVQKRRDEMNQKAKDDVCDDVLYGWEWDKENPEVEIKNGLERPALAYENHVMLFRIADLLRRMP
jgi:hypothetical protein